MQESKNRIGVFNLEALIAYITRIQQMQNLRCRDMVVFPLYPLPMGNNVIQSRIHFSLLYCSIYPKFHGFMNVSLKVTECLKFYLHYPCFLGFGY